MKKSSLNKHNIYMIKNSSVDEINLDSKNKLLTKKRRRKTVETSSSSSTKITSEESFLININKIRLSKSDDTFDLKFDTKLKLNISDQIVPVVSDEDDDDFNSRDFNQLKLYQQISVII
jgi:hypothetical protein